MDTKLTRPTTPLSATTPLGEETAPLGGSTTFSASTPAAMETGRSPAHSHVDGGSNHGLSDDTELRKRILETHESDELGIAVKPTLHIIDVIFYRAFADFPGYNIEESDAVSEDETSLQDHEDIEIPWSINSAISSEMFRKCSLGEDVETIVMDILYMTKHYSWESKVVLALVAFAMTFAEFWNVLQLYPIDPLAKAFALFTQLPEVLEDAAVLKLKLDAFYSLVKEIIDVAKKIIEFYDIPKDYFTAESPEILAAADHIPTLVFGCIVSIVVSAIQIYALTGMDFEYLTEPRELSALAHDLNNSKGYLVEIIECCYKFIERKKDDEAFELIVGTFTTSHIDNSKPLGVLFKDDPEPFYDPYNERRIKIEDLREKVVALFLTEIDPVPTRTKDYAILQQMYFEKQHNQEKPESQYEVIWVPVADVWTEDKYRWFEILRNKMEWYSVHHPSVVSPMVLRFFREKWNFSKMPLLVVMDTEGRIVHNNAIYMMCIWETLSYPFTTDREKFLWEKERLTIDLLVNGLEPNMFTWINEGKYVCLYGGDDMEWIRKFTGIAKEAALECDITLELLYVGSNSPNETITKQIIDLIGKENLSKTLDWNLICFFWVRLEGMWNSKGQYTDRGIKEIVRRG